MSVKSTSSGQASTVLTQARDADSAEGVHRNSQSLLSVPEKKSVLAWNNTPSAIDMQKHILNHGAAEDNAGFNVAAVLEGKRTEFAERGEQEAIVEEFISAAAKGDVDRVGDLLHTGKVYVDVADRNGHTALMAACVSVIVGGLVYQCVLLVFAM